MKKLLLLCLSLTLVLSQYQKQCQAYESFNKATKRCNKVCNEKEFYSEKYSSCIACDEGEAFNSETDQCESICEEGQTYNSETQQCDEPVCDGDQSYNAETKQCEENENPQTSFSDNQIWDSAQNSCVEMSRNDDGEQPDGGDEPDPYENTPEDPPEPQEDPEQPDKCNGGIMINNKCICFNGKKLVKGECKENKCKGVKWLKENVCVVKDKKK